MVIVLLHVDIADTVERGKAFGLVGERDGLVEGAHSACVIAKVSPNIGECQISVDIGLIGSERVFESIDGLL